ncbi:MAG: hypothetical protein U5K84_06980 [Alkalibacterium sp.]|nr:hypothetical protein [Alkalibacterium sp.]
MNGAGQTAEPTERAEASQTTQESGEAETTHAGSQRKNELLNSWKERALAIYGTVSLEHLKTIWNRHFDEQVTIEEINERLNH